MIIRMRVGTSLKLLSRIKTELRWQFRDIVTKDFLYFQNLKTVFMILNTYFEFPTHTYTITN